MRRCRSYHVNMSRKNPSHAGRRPGVAAVGLYGECRAACRPTCPNSTTTQCKYSKSMSHAEVGARNTRCDREGLLVANGLGGSQSYFWDAPSCARARSREPASCAVSHKWPICMHVLYYRHSVPGHSTSLMKESLKVSSRGQLSLGKMWPWCFFANALPVCFLFGVSVSFEISKTLGLTVVAAGMGRRRDRPSPLPRRRTGKPAPQSHSGHRAGPLSALTKSTSGDPSRPARLD